MKEEKLSSIEESVIAVIRLEMKAYYNVDRTGIETKRGEPWESGENEKLAFQADESREV